MSTKLRLPEWLTRALASSLRLRLCPRYGRGTGACPLAIQGVCRCSAAPSRCRRIWRSPALVRTRPSIESGAGLSQAMSAITGGLHAPPRLTTVIRGAGRISPRPPCGPLKVSPSSTESGLSLAASFTSRVNRRRSRSGRRVRDCSRSQPPSARGPALPFFVGLRCLWVSSIGSSHRTSVRMSQYGGYFQQW